MPNLSTIRTLYQYNTWANGRVFDATAALPPEAFLRDLGNSFPSIRDTLVHIVGAEWVWLERWHGNSPPRLPPGSDFSSHDAVRARWAEVERDQARYLAALTEDILAREVAYTNLKGQPFRYPLWQQLLHVVNHSTYHRGQVTTMLRQLGARPVSTDLLVFYDSGRS